MDSQRTYRASAIVLRRINVGEADRIVTLYTREKGKLTGIAKGARKSMSKLAGPTEPFTYGRYFMAVGRELDILTQVEIKESFQKIRKDLNRIAHASYMVELVNAMVEEREANYEMFDTLLSSLYLLDGEVDPEVVVRHYELQIMSLMGYRPELNECVRCGRPVKTDGITFSPSLGGVACEECGPLPDDVVYLSGESTAAMRALLTTDPSQLKNIELSEPVKDELFHAIRWYVRYRLDRDLKSSEFLQALAAASTRPQGL